VAAADLEPISQELFSHLLAGGDIPDEVIENLRSSLSKGINKDINVDSSTGKVSVKDKDDDNIKELVSSIGMVTSGMSNVTQGLNSLGVTIPEEVGKTVDVINAIMQVVQGITQILSIFNSTTMVANTTAIGLNTTAIAANTTALGVSAGASAAAGGTMAGAVAGAAGGAAVGSAVPVVGTLVGAGIGFAIGSLLFANGGIVPHAANGFMIPGGSFSGDTTPVLANAGELILSRSQQNSIASQLDGNGLQNLSLSTEFDIEKLIITLNNRYGRTGYGEIVTSQKTY
jgi:hypothetical protein